MLPIDQLKTLSETGYDAASQIARLILEGQEKMIGLSVDATRNLIKGSSAQLDQTCREVAEQDASSAWPALLAGNLRCGTAISQLLLTVSGRWQKDLTALSEAQLLALNSEILDEVNKYSRTTRILAATAVRSGDGHPEGKSRSTA